MRERAAVQSRVVAAAVREWNPLPLAKMGRGREREREAVAGEWGYRRRAAVRQSLFWLGKNATAAQRAADSGGGGDAAPPCDIQ